MSGFITNVGEHSGLIRRHAMALDQRFLCQRNTLPSSSTAYLNCLTTKTKQQHTCRTLWST